MNLIKLLPLDSNSQVVPLSSSRANVSNSVNELPVTSVINPRTVPESFGVSPSQATKPDITTTKATLMTNAFHESSLVSEDSKRL